MEIKLNKSQILAVVKFWYTQGLCPDIFQTDNGIDLEEYVDDQIGFNQHEEYYNTLDCLIDSKVVIHNEENS